MTSFKNILIWFWQVNHLLPDSNLRSCQALTISSQQPKTYSSPKIINEMKRKYLKLINETMEL